MRSAFWNTVTDAKFQADAKKRNLPVIPVKGAKIQSTIVSAMKTMSPAAIAKARTYIFGKKVHKRKK